MTFEEARTILREDKLAHRSDKEYSDPQLLRYLTEAAREVAGLLQFPTAEAERFIGTNASGEYDGIFFLPADAVNLQSFQLTIDNVGLQEVDYETAMFYRRLSQGLPLYYQHDPNTGGRVMLAPVPNKDVTVKFKYQQKIHTEVTQNATSKVWFGRFEPWHHIIVDSAVAKAFRKSGREPETAALFTAEYRRGLREMAVSIGFNDDQIAAIMTRAGNAVGGVV